MKIDTQHLIQQAAQRLQTAQSVVCLTGAGVSAESGLDTFRDAQTGVWSKFDPEQLASQAGFAANPGFVWRWYMERLESMQQALPNPGHVALAQLEQFVPQLTVVTQNIDDLHERGGSTNVKHIHGSIAKFRCNGCEIPYPLTKNEWANQEPPHCPSCGDLVRPDVVWFGEMLPRQILEESWLVAETCDVMLVIGTSGVVYPAAHLPYIAQEAGAVVIEINPDESLISEMAHLFIQLPSGEALPRIVKEIEK